MKLGIAKKSPACTVSLIVFPNSKAFGSLQLLGYGCHRLVLLPRWTPASFRAQSR